MPIGSYRSGDLSEDSAGDVGSCYVHPRKNLEYYLFAATTVIKVALNLVKAFQEHEQASKNLKRARSVERCLKEFAPTLAMRVANCEGLGGEWANVD